MERFFITSGFFLAVCLYTCSVFADGDFQYWNTESISSAINNDFRITLEEEFRFGGDSNTFFYQHSDIGLTYSGFAKWLDLAINYRNIFEKSNTWEMTHSPHFNVIVKWEYSFFSFSNRFRFEYRNKEDAEDYWLYRNQFAIKLPFKVKQLQIQPYIANELFYDLTQDSFNRIRFNGGFDFRLADHWGLEIYYLWQNSKKDDRWEDLSVLGTKFKLSFSF